MSLLMDALRRAEQAKEQGQTEQHGAAAGVSAAVSTPPSVRLATGGATTASADKVDAAAGGGAVALSLDDVTPVIPAAAGAADMNRPDAGQPLPQRPRVADAGTGVFDQAAHRQARSMLAARAQQSRRRRLIITAGGGVALLVAVLVFVYFDVVVSTARLHEPQAAISMAGQDIGDAVSAEEAANDTASGESAGAAENAIATNPTAVAESPAASRSDRPAARTARAAVAPAAIAEPVVQPAPAQEILPAAPVVIVRNESEDPLQVLLTQAFDDYQSGDDARAETAYRQALARDANNRDALLGLAAVAQRGGRPDEARLYYSRLLELNPLDSAPAAGLIGLRDGADPVQDESRIKLLLRQEPAAAHLHFALGTLYVAQGRWAEAQQAFFDAFHHDPGNADYAFNLAICLERLGQPVAALDYYRRAVDLARGRSASFNASEAARRIEALSATATGEAG